MVPIPYRRLSALYFVYFAAVGIMSPYWPVYLNSLGFSGSQIGLIFALPMLTRCLAPSLWGSIADRTGEYLRVVQLGAGFAVAGFLGLFFYVSFWGVVFFTLIFTFFWNAVLPQIEVITLDYLVGRTSVYSRIRLWGSVGFICTVAGVGMAFETFPPSIILGLIWLCLWGILAISLCLTRHTHSQTLVEELPSTPKTKSRVIQRGTGVFLLSSWFLHISHGAFYGFYSLYLLDHGYSSTSVGLLWALGVTAEIILFTYVPKLFSRYSLKACLVFSMLMAVIRWLMVAVWVDSLIVMAGAQVLHAFTFGLAHSVAVEFMRKNVPATARGKGQALYSAICFGAGGATGAYVSGGIWSWGGQWCFLFAAISAFLGLAIALWGVRDN